MFRLRSQSATIIRQRRLFSYSHPRHDASNISETVMKVGDLKAQGLCNWTPPGVIEMSLEYLNAGLGIPWGLAIIGSALTARLLIFPLFVQGHRVTAKLSQIAPEAQAISQQMAAARAVGDQERVREYTKEMMDIYSKHNVNPLHGLKTGLLSAPIMVSFFMALRDVSELNLPALENGGMLWFTNLNVPDPYYILPVLATGSFLFVVEKGMEMPQSSQSTLTKNIFRAMAACGLPLMASYPAALSLYWVTNSLFTIGATMGLKNKAVRRLLEVPDMRKQDDSSIVEAAVVGKDKIRPVGEIEIPLKPPSFMESIQGSFDVVAKDHPDHPLVKAYKKSKLKRASQEKKVERVKL